MRLMLMVMTSVTIGFNLLSHDLDILLCLLYHLHSLLPLLLKLSL